MTSSSSASQATASASRAVSPRLERPQRELDRGAHPAQLGAQAAQAVRVGRHLVARDRDQQQRRLAQAGGDAGEQQQRRLVGPVEVVEHDRDGPARGDLRERAPQRLDQRRLAGIQRRDPELGQQRREIGRQRAAGLGDVGRLAQALAQHLGDGVVRLGDGRARRAAEGREPRLRERCGREPGLADARLARDEHARAHAVLDRAARGLEGGQFLAPADHRPALEHSPEFRAPGRAITGLRADYGSRARRSTAVLRMRKRCALPSLGVVRYATNQKEAVDAAHQRQAHRRRVHAASRRSRSSSV